MVNWIRSRARKREEPAGEHCTGCRTFVAGGTDDELRASGGVLLEGVGWFCCLRCERQYRFRFRIQPATTPTETPARPSLTPSPRPAVDEDSPDADELAALLRERRRRLLNGS